MFAATLTRFKVWTGATWFLRIREALCLSQWEMAAQFSERAGVAITYKNISKYERGRSVLFIEIVLAYARLCDVSMNQIVDDALDLPLNESEAMMLLRRLV